MSNRPAHLEPGARPDDDIWYESKREDYAGRHRVIEGEPVEVTGQMVLPFEEPIQQGESPRQHQYVTGFALVKTPAGDWAFVGDIESVLDIDRPPSDDEVRHGATEAAEYLRTVRIVDQIIRALQPPQPAHSH